MQAVANKGFTLIEVMVTIVIVSVGMLSLAGLLITGIKVNAASESRMDASGLAQGVMSRLSIQAATVGYTQAQALTDAQSILAARYSATGTAGGYNPVIIMTPTPAVAGFTSVIVRLQWDDHGSMKQVELRSGVVSN